MARFPGLCCLPGLKLSGWPPNGYDCLFWFIILMLTYMLVSCSFDLFELTSEPSTGSTVSTMSLTIPRGYGLLSGKNITNTTHIANGGNSAIQTQQNFTVHYDKSMPNLSASGHHSSSSHFNKPSTSNQPNQNSSGQSRHRSMSDQSIGNNPSTSQSTGQTSGNNPSTSQSTGQTSGNNPSTSQSTGKTSGNNPSTSQSTGQTSGNNPSTSQSTGQISGNNPSPSQQSTGQLGNNPGTGSRQSMGQTSGNSQTSTHNQQPSTSSMSNVSRQPSGNNPGSSGQRGATSTTSSMPLPIIRSSSTTLRLNQQVIGMPKPITVDVNLFAICDEDEDLIVESWDYVTHNPSLRANVNMQ